VRQRAGAAAAGGARASAGRSPGAACGAPHQSRCCARRPPAAATRRCRTPARETASCGAGGGGGAGGEAWGARAPAAWVWKGCSSVTKAPASTARPRPPVVPTRAPVGDLPDAAGVVHVEVPGLHRRAVLQWLQVVAERGDHVGVRHARRDRGLGDRALLRLLAAARGVLEDDGLDRHRQVAPRAAVHGAWRRGAAGRERWGESVRRK
jgi:hypothetical protein